MSLPSEDRHRRRNDNPLAKMGVVVVVLGQLFALIWGAARISSSTDMLIGAVAELKMTTESMRTTLINVQLEQARQRAEIDAMRRSR